MFDCEKDLITELLPQWSNHTRSVDENCKIMPIAKPRGYGGVSTLWKPWLDPYAVRLPDGNERIVGTQFNIEGLNLNIFNCYLDSAKTANAIARYHEDITAISELLYKYKDGDTLIVGDMNADIYRRDDAKEKLLKQMMEEHNLSDATSESGRLPTYQHKYLGHESHVDMILLKLASNKKEMVKIEATEVLSFDSDENLTNASTHVPVLATLALNVLVKHPKKKAVPQTKKFIWSKADAACFTQTMQEELDALDLTLINPDQALSILQSIIECATIAAVPSTNKGPVRVGKSKWYPELQEAVATAKKSHHAWKEAEKPHRDHPLAAKRRKDRKQVRRIQRQHEAAKHTELLGKISDASESDSKLFYQLIRKQRATPQTCSAIRVGNGDLSQDDDVIREAWAEHFEHLANGTSLRELEAPLTLQCIRLITKEAQGNMMVEVPTQDIAQIIRTLKNGKACDSQGLCAEQLKMLPEEGVEVLQGFVQNCLKTGTIPNDLKTGYKIPIPKPKKDTTDRNNYRGITITSIFSKILERVILQRIEPMMDKRSNPLQFGFTKGKSPTLASLCLAEAIAEARDTKGDLFVATLDASKAFDVVNHNILKEKLYHEGIDAALWSAVDDIYTGCNEVVRWKGSYSKSYQVNQGVRQGGILSPHLYKLYINQLLDTLTEHKVGLEIGNIYLGTPTCADDQLLLAADGTELQNMLDCANAYAEKHQYHLHPTKSKMTHHIKSKINRSKNVDGSWKLGEEPITQDSQYTHLGLDWSEGKTTPDIPSKIKGARGAAYAMMGVGLHGQNGLDPSTSVKLIQTYITPRLIYGLDGVVLQRKDIESLEVFYRGILRQIQGLPDTVANCAVYLLADIPPLEAQIHMRTLGLWGCIINLNDEHPLRMLATRQLAVKDNKSGSWFKYVEEICLQYEIDIHNVNMFPWPKHVWKQHVKEVVLTSWRNRLNEQASQKSSLAQLIVETTTPNKIWSVCKGRTHLVEAATIRARLLTGRYLLQSNRARFNQFQVDPTCPLCGDGSETTQHFLLECVCLDQARAHWVGQMAGIMEEDQDNSPNTNEEWCQAILNGGAFVREGTILGGKKQDLLEIIASRLCFALHRERDLLLNDALMRSL